MRLIIPIINTLLSLLFFSTFIYWVISVNYKLLELKEQQIFAYCFIGVLIIYFGFVFYLLACKKWFAYYKHIQRKKKNCNKTYSSNV